MYGPREPVHFIWTDLWKILSICFSILTIEFFHQTFSTSRQKICLYFLSSAFDFAIVYKSVCRDIYINNYNLKSTTMVIYSATRALLPMLTQTSNLNFKQTHRSTHSLEVTNVILRTGKLTPLTLKLINI